MVLVIHPLYLAMFLSFSQVANAVETIKFSDTCIGSIGGRVV